MTRKDLFGQKFNRLTVIDWDNEKHKWKCECDCGNETYASSNQLTKNNKKSCGCLDKEKARERAIKRNIDGIILCDYEVQADYVIMYTSKNEPFLVDLEDFWKVKDCSCHIDKYGYVIGRKDGVRFKLHRYIMDAPDGFKVDHENHDHANNCKYNLRLATSQENSRNRKPNKNNKSGCSGVYWTNHNKKWCATIGVDGKSIFLGNFVNKEDAIKARIDAENKYYGEFGYHNSMRDTGYEVQYE